MALRQDNASEGAASFEILKTGPFFDQAAPFLGGPNVTHPYPKPPLKNLAQCRFDESNGLVCKLRAYFFKGYFVHLSAYLFHKDDNSDIFDKC